VNSPSQALLFVFAMGVVILFCRAFPFLFFSGREPRKRSSAEPPAPAGRKTVFLNYVEKTVPPAAMTVLAFNILGASFRDNPRDGLLVLAASVLTALVHLWKRNSLVSIFSGTALYMILTRI